MISPTISLVSKSASTRADSVTASIMNVLAYFDMFHYPLTLAEIVKYLDHPTHFNEVKEYLELLQEERKVFVFENYYCLHNNPLLIYRRKQGNQNALRLLPKAQRIGRFLFRIPFVRTIGISGSLSKNYADQCADFDFFIITQSNRLWVARTLMHLLKKLSFLFGRQDWFCMNYYIDETALLIPEQNIYTAIEIKTLIPVKGEETFQLFTDANKWTQEFLPNFPLAELNKPSKASMIKSAFETCLSGSFGNWLDNFLFSISVKRWQRKAGKKKKNGKGYVMDLITGKHFARSNPGNFQEKLMARYASRLKEFENLKI